MISLRLLPFVGHGGSGFTVDKVSNTYQHYSLVTVLAHKRVNWTGLHRDDIKDHSHSSHVTVCASRVAQFRHHLLIFNKSLERSLFVCKQGNTISGV